MTLTSLGTEIKGRKCQGKYKIGFMYLKAMCFIDKVFQANKMSTEVIIGLAQISSLLFIEI